MSNLYWCLVSQFSRNRYGGQGEIIPILHTESDIIGFANGKADQDIPTIDDAVRYLRADGHTFEIFPDTPAGVQEFIVRSHELGCADEARELAE